MKKLFSVLGILIVLAACATAPAPRQIQTSFPLEKPFDPVWQTVIEVFAELNLPIMNMEKVSGLITTDWINFTGQNNINGYCDCGGLGMNREVERRGRFNVYVKKVGDSSCELKVNSIFEHIITSALDNTSPHYTNACVSTGKLEAEIFKRIQEKIK